MQKFLLSMLILCASIFLCNKSVVAQPNNYATKIQEALKSNNAKELAKLIFQTVEYSFQGKADSYSKAQAEFVIRDFFRNYPAQDVQFLNSGKSKEANQSYCIYNYQSKKQAFRIFMQLNNNQDYILITKIRIENDNN